MRIVTTLGFILPVLLSACASPAQRADDRAANLGFRKILVQGAGFSHVVYFKEGVETAEGSLHVYLEGDGTPWLRKGLAAADPTPRKPLMLDLMYLDSAPAIYLGRPCYHGLSEEPACTPIMWTDGRYSEAVVASMSAVLEKMSAHHSRLVLLGYSGGGTLAMLIAERQFKVKTVVTVAANLDIDSWSDLRRQHRLSDSLNPSSRPPLRREVRQFHNAGEKDANVPPSLVRQAAALQQNAALRVYPDYDHSCCWKDVWLEILKETATD